VGIEGDFINTNFDKNPNEVKIMALKDQTIAFIGGGHITEIIVSNLTGTNKVVPQRLIVSDPLKERAQKLKRAYGTSIAEDNMEAVFSGDFIFINVLPLKINHFFSMGNPFAPEGWHSAQDKAEKQTG